MDSALRRSRCLDGVAVFQSGPDSLVYDVVILLRMPSFLVERLTIRSREGSVEVRSDRGRALVDSLGDEYLPYSKKVKRIIPFVLWGAGRRFLGRSGGTDQAA
jgi:hypothetical protein